jgi:HTH-type transcriptional regulator/antitoxin HipB
MNGQTAFPLQSAEQLALYLRSLRRSRGLTQRALGEILGVTGARISEIEKDPSGVGLAQLLRLLHVLGARAVIEVPESRSASDTTTTTMRGEW